MGCPKSPAAYCTTCGKQLAQSPSRRGKSGLCHSCAVSRPFTEDHKQKIADALSGVPKTKEHRERLSIVCKERYKDPSQCPWWKGGKRSFYHKIARQVAGVSDPNMAVHHIDGDYTNNAPENLEVMTREEHDSLHNLQGRAEAASNSRWKKR